MAKTSDAEFLAFQAVPFILNEEVTEGRRRFVDAGRSHRRSCLLGALAVGMSPTIIVVIDVMQQFTYPLRQHILGNPDPLLVAILVGGFGFSGLFVWVAMAYSSSCQILELVGKDQVSVQRKGIGSRKQSSLILSRNSCVLQIHPVTVQYSASGRWHGFACIVHVGDRRVPLAVVEEKVDCVRIAKALPNWLPALSDTEGESVVTFESIRVGAWWRSRVG